MAEEKKNWLGPYIPQDSWIREVAQQIKLVYSLMMDRRVHPLLKLLPVAVAAYVISPVDLSLVLPGGILPGISALDDVVLATFGLRMFIELAPPDVVHEHLQRLTQTIRGNWKVSDNPPPPPANEGDVVEGTFRKEE